MQVNMHPLRIGGARVILVWLAIFSLLGIVVFRLLWIQVLHPDRLIAEGNARMVRNYYYEPPRGLITDRNGEIMAISVPVKTVDADPKIMHESGLWHDPQAMAKIASLLELDIRDLQERTKDKHRRFVHLKRYLNQNAAESLKAFAARGILLNDSYKRIYPSGSESAPLIGILNGEGEGVYGIEQSFNRYLTSSASSRIAKKDRFNRIIENVEVTKNGNQEMRGW